PLRRNSASASGHFPVCRPSPVAHSVTPHPSHSHSETAMNASNAEQTGGPDEGIDPAVPPIAPDSNTSREALSQQDPARHETRRWWIKLFVQPLLFLLCGAVLLGSLGLAQRMGWITGAGG